MATMSDDNSDTTIVEPLTPTEHMTAVSNRMIYDASPRSRGSSVTRASAPASTRPCPPVKGNVFPMVAPYTAEERCRQLSTSFPYARQVVLHLCSLFRAPTVDDIPAQAPMTVSCSPQQHVHYLVRDVQQRILHTVRWEGITHEHMTRFPSLASMLYEQVASQDSLVLLETLLASRLVPAADMTGMLLEALIREGANACIAVAVYYGLQQQQQQLQHLQQHLQQQQQQRLSAAEHDRHHVSVSPLPSAMPRTEPAVNPSVVSTLTPPVLEMPRRGRPSAAVRAQRAAAHGKLRRSTKVSAATPAVSVVASPSLSTTESASVSAAAAAAAAAATTSFAAPLPAVTVTYALLCQNNWVLLRLALSKEVESYDQATCPVIGRVDRRTTSRARYAYPRYRDVCQSLLVCIAKTLNVSLLEVCMKPLALGIFLPAAAMPPPRPDSVDASKWLELCRDVPPAWAMAAAAAAQPNKRVGSARASLAATVAAPPALAAVTSLATASDVPTTATSSASMTSERGAAPATLPAVDPCKASASASAGTSGRTLSPRSAHRAQPPLMAAAAMPLSDLVDAMRRVYLHYHEQQLKQRRDDERYQRHLQRQQQQQKQECLLKPYQRQECSEQSDAASGLDLSGLHMTAGEEDGDRHGQARAPTPCLEAMLPLGDDFGTLSEQDEMAPVGAVSPSFSALSADVVVRPVSPVHQRLSAVDEAIDADDDADADVDADADIDLDEDIVTTPHPVSVVPEPRGARRKRPRSPSSSPLFPDAPSFSSAQTACPVKAPFVLTATAVPEQLPLSHAFTAHRSIVEELFGPAYLGDAPDGIVELLSPFS